VSLPRACREMWRCGLCIATSRSYGERWLQNWSALKRLNRPQLPLRSLIIRSFPPSVFGSVSELVVVGREPSILGRICCRSCLLPPEHRPAHRVPRLTGGKRPPGPHPKPSSFPSRTHGRFINETPQFWPARSYSVSSLLRSLRGSRRKRSKKLFLR